MQMIAESKNYSAIILAAGKSERMGIPKFLLKFDEDKTFLEVIANNYQAFGCDEIVVVVNADGFNKIQDSKLTLTKNIKLVINEHPEWERFYSLKLGVDSLKENRPAFINNIDNPFNSVKILDVLSINLHSCDYLYPVYKGRGGHPILISSVIVEDIIAIKNCNLNLKMFLQSYSKKGIEVDDKRVLLNINTPENYNNIFHLT